MRKSPPTFTVLLALCLILAITAPASESCADMKITVSFAAGGVACGIYFFISFSTGNFNMPLESPDKTALLNLGPEGWQPGVPWLKLTGAAPGPLTPYLDILQFRF